MDFFSEEYQQVWQVSKYPRSFYTLWGFVMGRYAETYEPEQGVVQRFFLAPHEKAGQKRIANLEKLCRELIREAGLIDDLEMQQLPMKHHHPKVEIRITSRSICDYIPKVEPGLEDSYFNPLFKPPVGTYALSLNQRLEFVAGAYLQHQSDEHSFLFHNNTEKALLVYRLLINLADEEDEVAMKSTFRTPYTHRITLNEKGSLWKNLRRAIKRNGYEI